MKKFNSILVAIAFCTIANAQTVLLSGIMDADCSNGSGKAIILYVDGNVDLTGYTLELQTNANTNWISSFDLEVFGTKANTFVYVARDSTVLSGEFPSVLPENIRNSGNITNFNGDDRIRLLSPTATVIDQYGVSAVDGTGEAWEYVDSYATRVTGSTATGSFLLNDWNVRPPNTLDDLGVCNGSNALEETVDFTSFLATNERLTTQTKARLSINNTNQLEIHNVELKSLWIYNSKGQILAQSTYAKVDISHLEKGVYFAVMEDHKGNVLRERFVKK